MLITKNKSENFAITGLQIGNTFNIRMEAFINKKEAEIIKVKFEAKSQIILQTDTLGDFNSCHIMIEDVSNIIVQKNQVEKLFIIYIKNDVKKQQYIEQRTYSTYIPSVC